MLLWIVGGIAGYAVAVAAAVGLCRAGATEPSEFHMADAPPASGGRKPRAA